MPRPRRVPATATAAVAVALAVSLIAGCGDSAEPTDSGRAADDTTHEHDHAGGSDELALFEVPAGATAPTISIDVEPDPVAGVNVHVTTTDFEVAPERASTDPVAGEGHFHVYVDGRKVARFYNESIHLPLSEGDHLVMVELSANDHSTYAVDGVPISDHTEVTAPASPEGRHRHEPIEAAEPAPAIDVTVTADPASGWNVQAAVGNLAFAPRSAGLEHVDGEGHLHLYVDGTKVTRLYGEWWHLDPLPAGEHEIAVEATANNHAPYTSGGEPVLASVTIDVTPEQAAGATDLDHGEAGGHDHGGEAASDGGAGTAIPVSEADTVVEIEVIDGSVRRDDTRVTVEEGATVAVIVSSDAPDRVHVHGYDILAAVGPDDPAEVVFTADSSGVFEVELEDTGLFLFDLQVG